MITIRFYSSENDKMYYECCDVISLNLRLTDGNPCDSFSVVVPYTEPLYNAAASAARVRICNGDSVVFTGIIDEIELSHSGDGANAELSGRGLAALLMQRECAGAEFDSASLGDIKTRYIAPCGNISVNADTLPPVRYFTVMSGTTCWRVLMDFCGWSKQIFPRFAPDGTLLLRGDAYDEKQITLDATAPVLSACIVEKRCGMVSEVIVTERTSNRSFKQKHGLLYEAGFRGTLNLAAPNGRLSAYQCRAIHALNLAAREWRTANVVLAEAFAAFPNDRVTLSLGGLPRGDYRVTEAATEISKRGAFTTLLLRRI